MAPPLNMHCVLKLLRPVAGSFALQRGQWLKRDKCGRREYTRSTILQRYPIRLRKVLTELVKQQYNKYPYTFILANQLDISIKGVLS